MSSAVILESKTSSGAAREPSLRRRLLFMVAVGLILRIAGMFLIHSYRVQLGQDESARIAASLASGRGFASPFSNPLTGVQEVLGPTAWLGPVYPFLLAGIFKIFGIYTLASSLVALLLNCIFSAVTCLPVFFIGQWTFGGKVAKWSAWAWTLLPFTMYWGIRWVWDTALSTLLFATAFMLTLQLARHADSKPWKWAMWGLLWGVAGLSNTAELAFLPFAGLWICWHYAKQNKPFFWKAALSAIIFFAVLAPWTYRNYKIFHKIIPVRGNFGLEFHLGNTPDANGMWQVWLHPSQNILEYRLYRSLGESAYVHAKFEQTLAFIRSEPGKFAFLTLEHFIFFWDGVPHGEKYDWIYPAKTSAYLASTILSVWGLIMAWRKRRVAAGLFVILLLTYPDVYYITFAHPRYRHPMEPMLLVLAVYLISETRKPALDYPKSLQDS